ncbi:MAG: recombination mediator RecR [Bacteroidota bacterium]
MSANPVSLEHLIDQLALLPSIGRKTAQRLALHILKTPKDEVQILAQALEDVKEKIRSCSVCWNFTENDPCDICKDTRRDTSMICVVEEPRDVLAFEKSNAFRGLYHVLGGIISPLDNIGPNDIKIKELLARMNGHTKEIILALNPTIEGEATILYLTKLTKPLGITISRIARGIPVGGELEFVDEATLASALKGRVLL